MRLQIELTRSAEDDLSFFKPFEQRVVLAALRRSLETDAGTPSQQRKPLRDSPLAPWELRIGDFRVFYELGESTVKIVAIGQKKHNELFIRGQRVQL